MHVDDRKAAQLGWQGRVDFRASRVIRGANRQGEDVWGVAAQDKPWEDGKPLKKGEGGKLQTPTVGLEPTTTRLRALRSAD